MERQDAVEILKRIRDPEPREPCITKSAKEALDMGIDALSEEPVYIKNDTVEKLDHILRWGHCICNNDDNEFLKALKNAIEIITALETLKTEIRDNANHCECVPDGSCISVSKVLEIIDKHIGGKDK